LNRKHRKTLARAGGKAKEKTHFKKKSQDETEKIQLNVGHKASSQREKLRMNRDEGKENQTLHNIRGREDRTRIGTKRGVPSTIQ